MMFCIFKTSVLRAFVANFPVIDSKLLAFYNFVILGNLHPSHFYESMLCLMPA